MRAHDEEAAEFILQQAEINHIPRGLVKLRYKNYINGRARTLMGPPKTYDVYGTEAPPAVR
jgi:hypothetical protein